MTATAETTEADAEDLAEETPTPKPKAQNRTVSKPQSAPQRGIWFWLFVATVVVAVAGGWWGYQKYSAAADQLAAAHRSEGEQHAVADIAKAYVLKSLTYSFEKPDDFFHAVEDGVSPALKDKYVNAADLLKGIMLQAQVTSVGEVLATEVTPQPGGVYQVAVAATQTTRNLQNPQDRVSNILLQVTLNKVGDTWQVSDIGPKTGSHAPNIDLPAPTPDKPGAAPRGKGTSR